MSMCICTYVTYMHICVCYLHTYNICDLHRYPYVGHMHIGMSHVDMWCICIYRDMTYIHCLYVNMSHMYMNMYIWHLRTYIHVLPMYICICDIDTYVTCVQMSIHL